MGNARCNHSLGVAGTVVLAEDAGDEIKRFLHRAGMNVVYYNAAPIYVGYKKLAFLEFKYSMQLRLSRPEHGCHRSRQHLTPDPSAAESMLTPRLRLQQVARQSGETAWR